MRNAHDNQQYSLEFPPGYAEEITLFILASAPRPVPEVAVVATLGLLAGICGRAYTVSKTGLNVYITLIARSAIGKEAMHSGIGLLLDALSPEDAGFGPDRPFIAGARDFVFFGNFASGPALQRACAECPTKSFVAVTGEWGHTLNQLARSAGAKGSEHTRSLRQALTDLFHKSGTGSVSAGTRYSDKAKNVVGVQGVAFSLIGESTPQTFYQAVDDSMKSDGFLSRFLLIEYLGPRPPLQEDCAERPPEALLKRLRDLIVHVQTLNANRARQAVEIDSNALTLLNSFGEECDDEINATDDESVRQPWNRAHLKAMKIAALLAVFDDHVSPVLTWDHAEWAIYLVRRDIRAFLERDKNGDIGNDDAARQAKLISVLKDYMIGPPPTSYGVPAAMQRDGMVPRKYMQVRTTRMSAFSNHPLGTIRALDDTVRSLCDSGYLVEVDKAKAGENYGFQGRCYRIVQLP